MGRATRERVILISREARKKYEEAFGLKPLFFLLFVPCCFDCYLAQIELDFKIVFCSAFRGTLREGLMHAHRNVQGIAAEECTN